MVIRCIVVDDEPRARKGIEDFIKRTPSLKHICSFNSAINVARFLKKNTIDILFLDIQMPDISGLDLMKTLVNPPRVIFTTAHREFALDGFELNAIDYLLKPITYNRFLRAVNKIDSLDSNLPIIDEYIFVKCDGKVLKIILRDILYIKTADDYVFIYTEKKKYMVLTSLKNLEEKLPKNEFIRVHRSYLIGIRHVNRIEGNLLYLSNDKIPISRNLKSKVYSLIIGNNLIERF